MNERIPLGTLIAAAHRELVRELEAGLRASGVRVRFSQFLALRHLSQSGPCTSGTLARALGLDAGATTRLVDDLVRRQLVHRTRPPADRRLMHVTLTEEGVVLFGQLRAINADVLEQAQVGLSPPEREQLHTGLAAVVDNLRRRQSADAATAHTLARLLL